LSALGLVLGRSQQPGLRGLAGRLFDMALPAVTQFTSPRAWAFALVGIHRYLHRFPGDRAAQAAREILAQRLLDLWRAHSAPDWPWFEDVLAYSNAALPHGLLLAGRGMGRSDMVNTALTALDWLVEVQKAGGDHFVPIGSKGFYHRGGSRARFDQQPVEAHVTVAACLEAWRVTGQQHWRQEAQRTFEWFLGPMISACRSTIRPPAGAVTGCTRIASIKTRGPSPRWPSCRHCLNCGGPVP